MPMWKAWVTRDYRFEDWVDVEADTKDEAEELGLTGEELEAVSVRVSGRKIPGRERESPARLWLELLRVDNVPMTWMDKLDAYPVDRLEDLMGALEGLAWNPSLCGDYWERYRPGHPWYARVPA
ncbi:MAG: hypothetical protein HN396_18740 [Gemmatimonadales bacterium]|jgi:hypothetical protein|nr:hypothetical protein [Gemmatimonadales bacterium]MBT7805970.1 hypothetical protein [Candidatus Poribacteria bacterium]